MAIVPVVFDCYHLNPVNMTEVAQAGMWGMIHKARQGLGSGDSAFASRRDAARALGMLAAAYDFATGDNVAANVAEFLSYTNAKNDPALGLWLDFEDNSASEMSGDQAYEFLDRVAMATGRACGIYGGNRISDDDPNTRRPRIDPQDADWIDMAKVTPLWQCRYISEQVADIPTLFHVIPPKPPWTANFLIQYTGDGHGPLPHTFPGLENGADLNAFNGDRGELTAGWVGMAVTVPQADAPSV